MFLIHVCTLTYYHMTTNNDVILCLRKIIRYRGPINCSLNFFPKTIIYHLTVDKKQSDFVLHSFFFQEKKS